MNHIIASFDKEFILEHIPKTISGIQAFSLFLINPKTHRLIKEIKKVKKINSEDFKTVKKYDSDNPYFIVNIQSIKINEPHLKTVYPIKLDSSFSYLWSSATKVINNFSYEMLKESTDDSYLLYNNKKLFTFINENNKYFSDKNLNFSTVKFEGCKPLKSGFIYEMSLNFKKMKIAGYK